MVLFLSFLFVLVALLCFMFGVSAKPRLGTDKDVTLKAQSERLKQDVLALYSTPQPRSIYYPESLNAASKYIQQEWEKLGLSVEKQSFEAQGVDVHNLIVRLGPIEGERWVVGAHYDACSEEGVENRGADDNASAVAVLLEISRLIIENKIELKRPLELVAYTTEEPPFFGTKMMGSYVHAESLSKQKAKVKGMLSLEMLGYFSEEKNSQEFPFSFLKAFYPSTGNFLMIAGDIKSSFLARSLKRSLHQYGSIPSYTLNSPDLIRGIQFSDHRNYPPFGYTSVMLTDTAFYRNKNYHQTTDTPDTLNYDKMADISQSLAKFLSRE